ncbi:MAG: protein-tyrosine phosphatase family protein [Acidimicrobiales bacterium]
MSEGREHGERELERPEALLRLGELSLDEFWWATSTPAPLAGMPYPRVFDWSLAWAAGFGAVIGLHQEPAFDPTPLSIERHLLQDLYGGALPTDSTRETEAVLDAVRAGMRHLDEGVGVIVHCAGGTGRTGTVVGGILVCVGFELGLVKRWLNDLHRARGRAGWPESSWQADVLDRVRDELLE